MPKKPGVYTRVTSVVDWIIQNTGVEPISVGRITDVDAGAGELVVIDGEDGVDGMEEN